jgi:hypothetical protein
MINFSLNAHKRNLNKAIATAIIAGTLSIGGSTLATTSAHAAGTTPTVPSISNRGDGALKQALATLVSKGTLTQAQADAVTAQVQQDRAALTPTKPSVTPQINGQGHDNGFGKGGFGTLTPRGLGFNPARVAIETSTIGQSLPQIQTQLQAGKSLADIAGANTQALITALVAFDTQQINNAVTAGTITPAVAAKEIASLTARVTAEVNAKGLRRPAFFGQNPNNSSAPSVSPSSF